MYRTIIIILYYKELYTNYTIIKKICCFLQNYNTLRTF